MSMLSRFGSLAAPAPAAATSPIQYVGGTTAAITASTGTTTNVSLTALTGGAATSAALGDLVIVYYGVGASADRTIGVTTAGYTEVAELFSNDANFDTNLSVSYKVMGWSPDTEVTVSATGGINDAGAVVVQVWRGVDPLNPFDATYTQATGIDTVLCDPPSITPSTAGAIIIAGGAGGHGAGVQTFSSSDLSNFTTTGGPNATNDITVGVGSKIWTSGAFNPAAFTFSAADSTTYSWAAITLALRPITQPGPIAIATSFGRLNGGDLTINKPTGTRQGDLMIAFVNSTGSSTWTAPSGWTEVADQGANPALAIAYKVATASEPGSYLFTASIDTEITTGHIVTYRNAAYDAVGAITTGANPLVVSAVTASVDYSRIVGVAARGVSAVTITIPAAMQLLNRNITFSPASVLAQDGALALTGSSGTRSFGVGATTNVSGALVAIKPAASYTKYANYIASNSGSAVTTTSVSVNTPARAPGNLLLFAVSASSGAGDNVSITTPTGWTLLSGNTTSSTAYQPGTYIFYRIADGAEAASYSATASTTCNLVGAIVTLAGVNAATLTAGTTSTGSGTTSIVADAVTATANGILLYFGAQANNNQGVVTFTPPSGMTEAVDVSADGTASDLSMEVAYQEGLSAGSTGTKTATSSSSAGTNRFRAILVTVGAL